MRKGKREREQLRRDYALVKEAKRVQVASNLSSLKSLPTSKGYRLSPDPKQGYQFHIHWQGMGTGRLGKVVRGKFIPKQGG